MLLPLRLIRNHLASASLKHRETNPDLPTRYSSPPPQPLVPYQTDAEPSFIGPLQATSSFNPLSANGTIILRLSRDHLIPLAQYNVFRATLTNMSILSLTTRIPQKQKPSPCLRIGPLFPAPAEPPPSLAPTPLQLSVPHELWIDILPHGTLCDMQSATCTCSTTIVCAEI